VVRWLIRWLPTVWLLVSAQPAAAAQVHAAPEGLYAHQIGHLIFIVAMGILIYWLRHRRLTHHQGWRRLQYAALFFILWNADAGLAHFLESRPGLFTSLDLGTWQARLTAAPGREVPVAIYYLVKMDHLLCVPAIVFLYLALRELLRDGQSAAGEERPR